MEGSSEVRYGGSASTARNGKTTSHGSSRDVKIRDVGSIIVNAVINGSDA